MNKSATKTTKDRRRRGQVIILTSIIIAIFMLSLALTITRLSTNRLEVGYEPVDEVVMAISSDFERCLVRALAKATQEYSNTANLDNATKRGELIIERWLNTVLEVYNGFGLNIALTPEHSTGRYVGWQILWSEGIGVSMVYTTFGMDIESYGLSNLVVTMQRGAHLNILSSKVEQGKISIRFEVRLSGGRSYFVPVADLTRDNVKLLVNESEEVSVVSFTYLGQGAYEASFNLDNLLAENVTLVVTDNDGVMVAATQRLCIIKLRSDDPSTPEIDNKGNFTVNGLKIHPPYDLLLSPGQWVTTSFTPPDGYNFIDFLLNGPIDVIRNGTTITIKAVGGGHAEVIALYGLLIEEVCYVTLESREGTSETSNLGSIRLILPNGTSQTYSLPGSVSVPYNQTIGIEYYPSEGYVFSYWSYSGVIVIENPSSQSTTFRALSNGTIVALYGKSRPRDWQRLYISPGERATDFVLTLKPSEKDREIQPISYGQPSQSGYSEYTTPYLYLGERVKIILCARATAKEIHLNVTLGFYNSTGSYKLGYGVVEVNKSNDYLYYEVSFRPEIRVIPKGSTLFLILERATTDPGGGTLHILCGPGKSRIELW